MALIDKTDEIRRLMKAFEKEAAKFYPLTLSLLYVTQNGPIPDRTFDRPNHHIMLWQYYGAIDKEGSAVALVKNLKQSDMKWGIRGAELSCFALLEGKGCELFVRMASRAGALFDADEARAIKSMRLKEILDAQVKIQTSATPSGVSNDNSLAIWLNYLLFHLSVSNPGREKAQRIEPDPFSLSLLALERLHKDKSVSKVDKSVALLSTLQFKVAMSFPGSRRRYVSSTVSALRGALPPDSIFYDYDYKAQLARPNLDVLLQDIYLNKSDLIVVFLCEEYAEKEWCGLEWRAVRDLIKKKDDNRIMFVRFDDATIEGVFSIDGYIDARTHKPQKLASLILQRLQTY
jgi:hypothetical protein